jgi:putative phosphonate metabolism protein
MRVAVFFTPPAHHQLTAAAARWLGRDPFTGETFPAVAEGALDAEALAALTAEPRRYGFHATMKAPFRLVDGTDLAEAEALLADFCRDAAPCSLPMPRIGALGPFFALVPGVPAPEIDELAACVVKAFDPLRAPPAPAELARRRRAGLTPSQEANLAAWGYPYVLNEFQFHMTLTGPVPVGQQPAMAELLHVRFHAVAPELTIDSLALFVEDEPGADFRVHAVRQFEGAVAAPSPP